MTRAAAARAGRIQASLRTDGEPIPFTDCLIAGATLDADGVLVTRDRDFERIDGLRVETH